MGSHMDAEIFMKASVADGNLGCGVKADWHAELLRFGVDWIELGLSQVQARLHIGRHHHADGVFFADGAADFLYGFRYDLRRDHRGVLDPIPTALAEITGPVVVRLSEFGGEIEFAHEADR